MIRKYLAVTAIMLSCVIMLALSSCDLITPDKDKFYVDENNRLTKIDLEKTGPDIVVPKKVGDNVIRRISLCDRYFSKIDTIDVSNVSELEFFKLNLLEDSNYSKLKKLDFSKNKKLRTVGVNRTKALKEIAFNESCEVAILFNTSIKGIDLKALKQLKYFSYFNGPLKDINFSNNTNLEHVDILHTNVNSVDIKMLKKLKEFTCYGFQIEELDISNNPELEVVEIYGTNVKVLDVSNNHKLKRIEVDEGTEIIGVTNAEIRYWTKEDIKELRLNLLDD